MTTSIDELLPPNPLQVAQNASPYLDWKESQSPGVLLEAEGEGVLAAILAPKDGNGIKVALTSERVAVMVDAGTFADASEFGSAIAEAIDNTLDASGEEDEELDEDFEGDESSDVKIMRLKLEELQTYARSNMDLLDIEKRTRTRIKNLERVLAAIRSREEMRARVPAEVWAALDRDWETDEIVELVPKDGFLNFVLEPVAP